MPDIYCYPESAYIDPFGLPFRVMFYRQSSPCLHYHDFEELVCVLEGSARHENDGRFYRISAGDVFLIPHGGTHAYHDAENLLLANILFKSGYLAEDELDLRDIPGYRAFFETEPALRQESGFRARLNLAGDGLEEIRLLVMKLERECTRKPPGYRFLARSYFRELVTLISRGYDSDEKKYSRRMVTLSKMLAFLDAHYAEPVAREDVVAAGRVSVSTANRIFQDLLHKSMTEHLEEIRIARARMLMDSTDLSISEIAFRCGFSDSNYFSTRFRRQTGLSPRDYRTNRRISTPEACKE